MRRIVILTIALCVAMSGCGPRNQEPSTLESAGGSVTRWTSKTELFMEYPALIAGTEARFALHLSHMSDFKPMISGSVTFRFISVEGKTSEITEPAPTSPGIYRPRVAFETPGTYNLTVIIDGAVRDTVVLWDMPVYATAQDVPTAQEQAGGEQEIAYLKEQQWRTDFRTEPVRREMIGASIRSAAEVIPSVNGEVIVPAPFTGYVPSDPNLQLPIPGSIIRQGAPLAMFRPSAETPGGSEDFTSRYTRADIERDLAFRDYERVKQLFARQNVSEKEFQQAEAEYRRADAAFKSLSHQVIAERDSSNSHDGFLLTAPKTGTLVEMNVIPGKQVGAGESLFRIINMDVVWIRANVAAADIGNIGNPEKAWLNISGLRMPLEINRRNGMLVSIGSALDPETRTLPLVFQRSNAEGLMRMGMVGEMRITGNEQHKGLVIPQSALMEEEGRYSVYVHVSGEAFVKRDVDLGAQEQDRVEVLRGLKEGERVVTRGAYQVRLASMSSQLPVHGHEH